MVLMNKSEGVAFLMQGAMRPWFYGREGDQVAVQVSINHAERLQE